MPDLACGIVGLPNVGKSTLFNALTATKQAEAANYPFCTIEPNEGVVILKDPRLEELAKISKSEKILYAALNVVDIAGLVEGASKGAGLGNAFLSHIRETDAIVHVVRCFESEDIVHVHGKVDPLRDVEIIELELILADLQMVHNILPKIEKNAKYQKEAKITLEALNKLKSALDEGTSARLVPLSDEEKESIKNYPFLSMKKTLYVANVAEKDIHNEPTGVLLLRERAEKEGNKVIVISTKIEEEIAQLSPEDRALFLEDLGLKESGLETLARASFSMLGLITFLTTGPMETRAWTITKGMTAKEAAGKIHTDISDGFIRAEVISFTDFIGCGGRVEAKEAGKVRYEAKEYIVQDGDVIQFMHK